MELMYDFLTIKMENVKAISWSEAFYVLFKFLFSWSICSSSIFTVATGFLERSSSVVNHNTWVLYCNTEKLKLDSIFLKY